MLNPLKCSFRVASGKFLSFIVCSRGIGINPDQIAATRNIKEPWKIRDVQSLARKVAALSRFISKAMDKCIPFLELIKRGKHKFEWTPDCVEAFQNLLDHLEKPSMLSKPIDHEHLFVYLAVLSHAISSALVREEDKIQRPVYYVSKKLVAAETNYLRIEKLAYSLLIASRKLHHYFQAHPITVYIDHPLKQVLQRPEASRRLLKWNIELSQFDLNFHPQRSIRGKCLQTS